MGSYDSSRTRVAPVFGLLQCVDPSGRLWLQKLLELANTRNLPRPQAGTTPLRVAKWWPREATLPAPPGLLRWLLENAEAPLSADAWGRRAEVKVNRRRIVDRDAATVAEALKNLQVRRTSSGAWYVLEGPSQPDVYLATTDCVVVIEGKRSERGPTTSTAWMAVRHQMLRYLDAAWEHRQGRRIYGLFIVEAEDGSGSVEPSFTWRASRRYHDFGGRTQGESPHRSPEERSQIASGLLGVTTWQALCDTFQVPREVLIPEALDNRPEPALRTQNIGKHFSTNERRPATISIYRN